MVITIGIKDLLYAIRSTSHAEVASIADINERYKAEAGLEKLELIKQCILESYATLLTVCHRFMTGDTMTDFNPAVQDATPTIDGHTNIGIDDFTFTLDGGARRFGAKNVAIGNKIREALKDYALSSFYTSVSQLTLADAHNKRAVADLAELNTILHSKRPPKLYIAPEPEPEPDGEDNIETQTENDGN